MKKVVVFGGGTGMSFLLDGLKLFPLDINAVVCVTDTGGSTGTLRDDYNIPAVGDITKVLLNIANLDDDLKELLNYRMKDSYTKNNLHSIKNLILTALLNIYGDLNKAIYEFSKLFNLDGKVLPITTDNTNLIAKMENGKKIIGEEAITMEKSLIKSIDYTTNIKTNKVVLKEIKEADLIIFSPGSLYTSVIPHLIAPKIKEAISDAKAKKIYVCNLITQPGETEDFTVSKHIEVLEEYLGKNVLDAVFVNNYPFTNKYKKQYEKENKFEVKFDKENVKLKHIADKLYKIEDGIVRHNSLKTGYLIYSYLMGDK